MEIYIILIIILVTLLLAVIYQSRTEPFNPKLIMQRFLKLVIIIFTYLKDAGMCLAIKFREIDWDVTQ